MTVGFASDRTRLRLVPAPPMDPPYDDEREPLAPRTEGSLALAFPPATPDALPLRLVPPARPGPDPSVRPRPDVGDWGARLAQAIVEVLVGSRSAAQLSRFASLDVLHKLERWTGRLAGRPGGPIVRTPRVASVRISEPVEGIVEACASVDTGPRRRALAMRLEDHGGRWQCTALELG
jgi:hypothetical protein